MKKILKFALVFVMAFVLAGCAGKKAKEALSDAKSYLWDLYKDTTETNADYNVITSIPVGDKTVSVTWAIKGEVGETVKFGEVVDGQLPVVVSFSEANTAAVNYTLVATLTYDEKSIEVEFERSVPAFKYATYAEYAAACTADNETSIIVKGVVSSIISKSLHGASKNCMYVQGEDGGFYVYNLANDPGVSGENEVKVGQTVSVSGTADIYSGEYEITNATIKVLDSTVKEVTPVDLTSAYAAAENLKADGLMVQGTYVEIKGVTILPADSSQNYYYFADSFSSTKKAYVRISSSVCPLTKAQQSAFISGHSEHQAYIADVKGIAKIYNGAFYLYPATNDVFTYDKLAELTAAEAVSFESSSATLFDEVLTDSLFEYQLPTTGSAFSNVSVSWAFKDDAEPQFAEIVEDGEERWFQAHCDEDEEETVTLVATFSAEGVTPVTQEFSVKINKQPAATDYKTAVEWNASTFTDDSVGFVKGIVTGYSESYKSCYIDDGSGEKVYLYSWFDKSAVNIKNGDYIIVRGTKTTYSSTVELTSARLYSQTESATLTELVALEEDKEVMASGIVTEVGTGTITIKDDNDVTVTVEVYDDADVQFGETTYAGLDVKVGYTVTITVSKSDSGYYAILYKSYLDHVVAHAGTEADPYDVADIVKVTDSLKESGEHTDIATPLYVTGYVKSISYQSSSYVLKVTIVDSLDATQTFLVYSANWGSDIASADKVLYVGDKITVKGCAVNVSGSIQLGRFGKDSSGNFTTSSSKIASEDSGYCEVVGAITRAAASVTSTVVDGEGEASTKATLTFTGATSGLNGGTTTFTIAVDTGYEVEVKYGTKAVTATDGVYTITFGYGSEVTVVVTEKVNKVTVDATTANNKYNMSTTANSTECTFTEDGIEYGYIKMKGGSSNYYYLMFTNGGYLYNKTAIAGTIKYIEVTTTSSASESMSLTVNFGTSEMSTKVGNSSATVKVGKGETVKFTCDVAGATYFQIENLNAGNSQCASFKVVYE